MSRQTIRNWRRDLCVSITPVLGPRDAGVLMRNSPRYAAWWVVAQINGLSDRKLKQLEKNLEPKASYSHGRVSKLEAEEQDLGVDLGNLGKIEEVYIYTDDAGNEVFQVVRLDPKNFRQRTRGPNGTWVWKNSRRDLLYRQPDVKSAIDDGRLIYVVEGEKDAKSLLDRGYIATTSPGGAPDYGQRTKWTSDHTEAMKGARQVIIIADNDQPGLQHGTWVYQALYDSVKDLSLVISPFAKDITDHLNQGHELSDLVEVNGDSGEINGDPPFIKFFKEIEESYNRALTDKYQ